ncbi:hypothetical protein [Streptomyces hyaluromycini]|uniref:hypothetical protein n=1 Tax=Streptomyces hyaluromycini TaxID=1377993 RepID=UPI0011AEB5D7|nr:hypothetical protein [Streptomyces hyaluromycini]
MLLEELDALVARLTDLSRPVVRWLVPGVGPGQVESLLGSPVPDEVSTWFGWCNGVALHDGQTQDDVNLIPGYSPLSLAEAVGQMGDHEGDSTLGSHWIPLLGGAGGDIYAAVWEPGKSAKVAGVLIGESTEIEFGSVEQMISVFNECYRRGAFFVDGQRQLAMDPGLYDVVSGEIVG